MGCKKLTQQILYQRHAWVLVKKYENLYMYSTKDHKGVFQYLVFKAHRVAGEWVDSMEVGAFELVPKNLEWIRKYQDAEVKFKTLKNEIKSRLQRASA